MEPNPNFGNVVSPHTPDGAGSPSPTPPPAELKPKRQLNIPFILAIVATVIALILGGVSIYYITQYNKEKTTVEIQKAEAAQAARTEQKAQDETEFAEAEKFPYRTYEAPAVLGAIKVEFPKNWNVFAAEDESAALQLDVFMAPGVVKAEKTNTRPYAFRMKLEQKLYTDSIENYQNKVEKGELTAEPVVVSGLTGTRFNGEIQKGRTGSIILLPLRDKTLSLWTESPDYLGDYNQIVSKVSISP